MAEELRFVTLRSSQSATADETNDAEDSFQNTTNDNIYLRTLDMYGRLADSDPPTDANYTIVTAQVSKQVSYIASSGDTNWKLNNLTQIHGDGHAAATVNSKNADVATLREKLAKGQIVLEPNDTIYLHVQIDVTGSSAATTAVNDVVIGYHF